MNRDTAYRDWIKVSADTRHARIVSGLPTTADQRKIELKRRMDEYLARKDLERIDREEAM